jgi:hypothetical protein
LLVVPAAARGLSRTSLDPRAVVGVICVGTLSVVPSVITYYSTSQKDSDVRPVVDYLLTHARHGPDAASDPVFIEPVYIEFKLNYYSRDAISYLAVPRGADLASLGQDPSAEGHEAWLIVDIHSRKFDHLDQDSRLQPVDVPGSNTKRIRLFRLVP